MPATSTVEIKLLDRPEIQAALENAARTVEDVVRERDEWEQRYEDLLASVGGTAPG